MERELQKKSDHIGRWLGVTVAAGAGLYLATGATSVRPSKRKQATKQEQTSNGGAGEEEEIAPAEDLMREHGVLNRLLLVYEESMRRLVERQDLSPQVVADAANLLRRFIEDYHEKLEENYLFPRFEQAGEQTDLVSVLRTQHNAGRQVTDQILHLATLASLKDPDGRQHLSQLIGQYVRMYRPHEAREDTVLFPALHKLVSRNEYAALGEEFEKKEHQLFGDEGFEKAVEQVAEMEQALGIHDLSQFTPR